MRISISRQDDKIHVSTEMTPAGSHLGEHHTCYASDSLELSAAMKLREMLDRAIHGDVYQGSMTKEPNNKWRISENYEIDTTNG